MIGIDVGNLAFNNNGATGPGIEDLVPHDVEVELPTCNWEEGI